MASRRRFFDAEYTNSVVTMLTLTVFCLLLHWLSWTFNTLKNAAAVVYYA